MNESDKKKEYLLVVIYFSWLILTLVLWTKVFFKLLKEMIWHKRSSEKWTVNIKYPFIEVKFLKIF